jgi:hypothetical protein
MMCLEHELSVHIHELLVHNFKDYLEDSDFVANPEITLWKNITTP